MTAAGRLPLPALLFALVLLAFVHWPLLQAPALLDEGPFLAGATQSRGASLGMQWLPTELALLGDGIGAHRWFSVALEGATLVAAAYWLAGNTRTPGLALLALTAYLVSPLRTESVVRLGARPVLVGEVLLASGLALLLTVSASRRLLVALGGLLIAAGASGLPTGAAFALPLLAVGSRQGAGRMLVASGALVVGAALSFLAAPPAAPLWSGLFGLELLVQPWRTGLVQAGTASTALLVAGGIVAAAGLLLHRAARKAAAANDVSGSDDGDRGTAGVALLAGLLAFATAPALRPARTGLDLLGFALTPDALLVGLGLVLVAAWRFAGTTLCSRLPLFGLLTLSLVGGTRQAARFRDPAELLDHAVAVAPEQTELRVLRGQLLLNAAGAASAESPAIAREFAREALIAAQTTLTRRPEDAAGWTLRCLALALLGDLDGARAASDRLLQVHPDDWHPLAARAEIEGLAGDDVGALQWLRAARSHGDDVLLRRGYAAALERVYEQVRIDLADRRFDAARARCARLVAVAPEELEAREIIVDAYVLQGDLPTALAQLERLYAEQPHRRTVIQRLASVEQRLGEEEKARHYQRLLLELPAEDGSPRR